MPQLLRTTRKTQNKHDAGILPAENWLEVCFPNKSSQPSLRALSPSSASRPAFTRRGENGGNPPHSAQSQFQPVICQSCFSVNPIINLR